MGNDIELAMILKCWICYILGTNRPICTKQHPPPQKKKKKKKTYWYSVRSNVAIIEELGHDLDLGFSKKNIDFDISQQEMA